MEGFVSIEMKIDFRNWITKLRTVSTNQNLEIRSKILMKLICKIHENNLAMN